MAAKLPGHMLSDPSPTCSPGRGTGTFDNEIVMMNHVYRERFPKVGTAPSATLPGPPPSLEPSCPSPLVAAASLVPVCARHGG